MVYAYTVRYMERWRSVRIYEVPLHTSTLTQYLASNTYNDSVTRKVGQRQGSHMVFFAKCLFFLLFALNLVSNSLEFVAVSMFIICGLGSWQSAH